jgi:hypothetical protein
MRGPTLPVHDFPASIVGARFIVPSVPHVQSAQVETGPRHVAPDLPTSRRVNCSGTIHRARRRNTSSAPELCSDSLVLVSVNSVLASLCVLCVESLSFSLKSARAILQTKQQAPTMLNKQQILDSITAVAKHLGHVPSRAEFISNSGISLHFVLQWFPSWNRAIKAARLRPYALNLRHPPRGCDVIVCWRHNWPCPRHLEIVELSTVVKSAPKLERESL